MGYYRNFLANRGLSVRIVATVTVTGTCIRCNNPIEHTEKISADISRGLNDLNMAEVRCPCGGLIIYPDTGEMLEDGHGLPEEYWKEQHNKNTSEEEDQVA